VARAAGWKEKRAAVAAMFTIILVLLAKDEAGYGNLIKLATAAHLEATITSRASIRNCWRRTRKALIALSGCLASEIPESIGKDQLPKAREAIDWFKQTLGAENFYLELPEPWNRRPGEGQSLPDSVGEGIRAEARRDE